MAIPDSSPRAHPSRSQRMVSPVLRIALLLGVAVHLAGFLVFRVVSNSLPDSEPEGAFIQYLSSGTLARDVDLEEKAILFDSAPLFIPTKWNTSSQIYSEAEGIVWQFPDFEPAINLSADLEPSARVLTDELDVTEPMDLLALRYWKFFNEFTSATHTDRALPETRGFAEVYLIDQQGVSWGSLPIELEYAGATAREPADYYLRIDGAGLGLGQPHLAVSSGSSSFDEAGGAWLKSAAAQYKLPAGYLLIRIFP